MDLFVSPYLLELGNVDCTINFCSHGRGRES